MKYLTDEERTLCEQVKTPEDWGHIDGDEIHRLTGAHLWELYDKWNGEGFEWVPKMYRHPNALQNMASKGRWSNQSKKNK